MQPDQTVPAPPANKGRKASKATVKVKGRKATVEWLADKDNQTALCDAIIEHGSVAAACRNLGLHSSGLWCHARDNEAMGTAMDLSRGIAWDARIDAANDLLDSATAENWQVVRMKIDTQLRIAGKLKPKTWGEEPTGPAIINNMAIVCDEATRARLIEVRSKMLGQRRPELSDSQMATAITAFDQAALEHKYPLYPLIEAHQVIAPEQPTQQEQQQQSTEEPTNGPAE